MIIWKEIENTVQEKTQLQWELVNYSDDPKNRCGHEWRLSFETEKGRIEITAHSKVERPFRLESLFITNGIDSFMDFMRDSLNIHSVKSSYKEVARQGRSPLH